MLLLPHSLRYLVLFTPTLITVTATPPDRPFPFSNSMAMLTRSSTTLVALETAVLFPQSRIGFRGGLSAMAVQTQQQIRQLRPRKDISTSRTLAKALRTSCVIIRFVIWVTAGPIPASLFHRLTHLPLSWISSMLITDPVSSTPAGKVLDWLWDGCL